MTLLSYETLTQGYFLMLKPNMKLGFYGTDFFKYELPFFTKKNFFLDFFSKIDQTTIFAAESESDIKKNLNRYSEL